MSVSIIGIHLYINTVQDLYKEYEKHLERYMETSSQNKYDLLNQQYQNSFNLLHELMHKCNEFITLMHNKEYNTVIDELEIMNNKTFKEFNDIYSNSVIFNTLIQNRKEYLSKHNINIKTTIEYNSFDFISFSDQIDLLNVVLDFIIHEAVLSKNKIIIIKTHIAANKIILSFNFPNNKNKTLEKEIRAALSKILNHYNAILSMNEINEQSMSLLLVFTN